MHARMVLRFLLVCLLTGFANAQTYPAKPVRIISPFAPGGPTDLLSRPISAKLHESLGQPFVIDYKAGAAGSLLCQASSCVSRFNP